MRDAPELFAGVRRTGSPAWSASRDRPTSTAFLTPSATNQMPAFGPDQLTDGDLDVLIRYLKDDYAAAASRNS